MAGGAWNPSAPILKSIRQDIFDNVEEYLEIIRNPEFAKHYPIVGEELLKTAPKGFPKDWEHIDLLKPRWFTATAPLPDRLMLSSKALSTISGLMRLLKPFDDFSQLLHRRAYLTEYGVVNAFGGTLFLGDVLGGPATSPEPFF